LLFATCYLLFSQHDGGLMKKLIYLALLALFAMIMAGCGGDNPGDDGKVTITFNTDGGNSVAPIKIDEGGMLPAEYLAGGSKVPSKTNNTFTGWLDGTTPVTAATTFSQSKTLKAQWTPSGQAGQITVSFSLGDGVAGTPPSPVTITNGTALGSKFPPQPSRDGWLFDGWYNNGTSYQSTTPITASGATFILTAEWEKLDDTIYPQNPAIHPGSGFKEKVPNATMTVLVNTEFSVGGIFSNVEPGAGVLSSKWYKTTTESDTVGVEIPELSQTAEGNANPHELSLSFVWQESVPNTYWYWVVVTNYNANATSESKFSSATTPDRLKVIVTDAPVEP
jgi:uncharacterized repeat protein (TIGR02543 family)